MRIRSQWRARDLRHPDDLPLWDFTTIARFCGFNCTNYVNDYNNNNDVTVGKHRNGIRPRNNVTDVVIFTRHWKFWPYNVHKQTLHDFSKKLLRSHIPNPNGVKRSRPLYWKVVFFPPFPNLLIFFSTPYFTTLHFSVPSQSLASSYFSATPTFHSISFFCTSLFDCTSSFFCISSFYCITHITVFIYYIQEVFFKYAYTISYSVYNIKMKFIFETFEHKCFICVIYYVLSQNGNHNFWLLLEREYFVVVVNVGI